MNDSYKIFRFIDSPDSNAIRRFTSVTISDWQQGIARYLGKTPANPTSVEILPHSTSTGIPAYSALDLRAVSKLARCSRPTSTATRS